MYNLMQSLENNIKMTTNTSFPPIKWGILGEFLVILGISAMSSDIERISDTAGRQAQTQIQPQLYF